MDATLSNLVDRLDRLIDAPDAEFEWRSNVTDTVRELRAAWARHHAGSDDEGGLYRDLAETEPRVSPLVRRLRGESLRIIECCDIALASLRRDAPFDEIRPVLDEIVVQSRRYIAHAATATYETVAVDLGSG